MSDTIDNIHEKVPSAEERQTEALEKIANEGVEARGSVDSDVSGSITISA